MSAVADDAGHEVVDDEDVSVDRPGVWISRRVGAEGLARLARPRGVGHQARG
ncbi:MAG: hypothetical protein V9H26_25290 [Verrucomicrobiota bacterium]